MKSQNYRKLLRVLPLASILTIVLFSSSCRVKQSATQVPIKTETTVVEKLVPVAMPADSASVLALFRCDSTNRVIMQKLSEAKTSNVNSRIQFSNGYLTYKTITKHDTVWVKTKDVTVVKDKPVYVTRNVYTNKLTWFQKSMIYSGVLLWAILIVIILIKSIKQYLKIHTNGTK